MSEGACGDHGDGPVEKTPLTGQQQLPTVFRATPGGPLPARLALLPAAPVTCPPAQKLNVTPPEFLQRPIVGGPVLLVLDLHSHDGTGEGAHLSVFGSLWGQ